jgi:hypothetical protein
MAVCLLLDFRDLLVVFSGDVSQAGAKVFHCVGTRIECITLDIVFLRQIQMEFFSVMESLNQVISRLSLISCQLIALVA